MADLIDRAALFFDIYETVVISGRINTNAEIRGANKIIDRIKAAKAVEVIRCCECKHYKPQNLSAHWEHSALLCTRSANIKMPPDGFCSRGERKET